MAGRGPEGFETETEITPEMLEAFEQEQPSGEAENESEYWRRYRAWRRNRFRRTGRRRRGSFFRRRFGGFGSSAGGGFGSSAGGGFSGGFGVTPSDDSGSGDDGDDDSQGEVRRYYARSGYRYPAYRAGTGYRYGTTAYRPGYRYGYGRSWAGRRYPYGVRSPYAGRYYYRGGRYWPYRGYTGAARYAPSASQRWPWYRRYYGGYRAPYYAPLLTAPAAAPAPAGAPMAGGGPSGSPWILLVQGCLKRLLGPGATPSDGVLGRDTRRALRAFQRQNGLPPSGDLDNPTVQALQGACMGGAATAAPPPPAEPAASGPPPDAGAAPPPEPPPAEPAAGGEPPADAGAAPPEGADGAGGDAPPPDAQGEIAFGGRESETEQEYRVDGPVEVLLDRVDPKPLGLDPEFKWMPNRPGLYVIFVNNKPWYIGISETSLRGRFLQRQKVLDDLQIPKSALGNRTVGLFLVRKSTAPRGAIQRKAQNNPRAVFRQVLSPLPALRLVEQVYMKLKGPGAEQNKEPIEFSAIPPVAPGSPYQTGGSLTIKENGVTVSQYLPNSKLEWPKP
jgi:peptidoglycan hydrolase-like protein with peptidoglycan-binding domain